MNKEDKVVKATGTVGTVYTTQTGMEEADPYKHIFGWCQINQSSREKVEGKNLTTHGQPFMSWRKV